MKPTLTFLIWLVCLIARASNSDSLKTIQVSVIGGVNQNSFSWVGNVTSHFIPQQVPDDHRPGFELGIHRRRILNKYWSWVSTASFSMRRFSFSYEYGGISFSNAHRLNVLNFSASCSMAPQFDFGPGRKLFINAGTNFYHLGYSLTNGGSRGDIPINLVYFGIITSFGIKDIRVGDARISLQVQWQGKNGKIIDDQRYAISTWNILVGYRIKEFTKSKRKH